VHVLEPACCGTLSSDRGHRSGDVGLDDLTARADQRRRFQANPSGSTGELENASAGAESCELEHPPADDGAALIHERRVGSPGAGDTGPHLVEASAELVGIRLGSGRMSRGGGEGIR
jgi:hypothetical protein